MFNSLDDTIEYAKELLRKHNLSDVKVTFNNKRTRVIASANPRKRELQLSKKWYEINLQNVDFIRNNILHEIAHFMSVGDHHGKRWKEACIVVGAVPDRFGSVKNFKHNKPKQATRRNTKTYLYTCSTCGKQYLRKRRLKSVSCGVCSNSYNPEFELTLTAILDK